MTKTEQLLIGAIAAVGAALIAFARKVETEADPSQQENKLRDLLTTAQGEQRAWADWTGETDPRAEETLRNYWAAAGVPDPKKEFGADWKKTPWSAAFISWLFSVAIPGAILPARGHWTYARAGLNAKPGEYQTLRPEGLKVQPGDLLLRWRDVPRTFDDLSSISFAASHADLALSFSGDGMLVLGVGGNKGQTGRVEFESYKLKNGVVADPRVFAIMRMRDEPSIA